MTTQSSVPAYALGGRPVRMARSTSCGLLSTGRDRRTHDLEVFRAVQCRARAVTSRLSLGEPVFGVARVPRTSPHGFTSSVTWGQQHDEQPKTDSHSAEPGCKQQRKPDQRAGDTYYYSAQVHERRDMVAQESTAGEWNCPMSCPCRMDSKHRGAGAPDTGECVEIIARSLGRCVPSTVLSKIYWKYLYTVHSLLRHWLPRSALPNISASLVPEQLTTEVERARHRQNEDIPVFLRATWIRANGALHR